MPSGLEALRQMELWPLPEQIRHRTLQGWSFFVQGRQLFEAFEPMASSLPCTLIDQESLLGWLVEQAERQQGFRFLRGSAVVDLIDSGPRVGGVVLAGGSSCGLIW